MYNMYNIITYNYVKCSLLHSLEDHFFFSAGVSCHIFPRFAGSLFSPVISYWRWSNFSEKNYSEAKGSRFDMLSLSLKISIFCCSGNKNTLTSAESNHPVLLYGGSDLFCCLVQSTGAGMLWQSRFGGGGVVELKSHLVLWWWLCEGLSGCKDVLWPH